VCPGFFLFFAFAIKGRRKRGAGPVEEGRGSAGGTGGRFGVRLGKKKGGGGNRPPRSAAGAWPANLGGYHGWRAGFCTTDFGGVAKTIGGSSRWAQGELGQYYLGAIVNFGQKNRRQGKDKGQRGRVVMIVIATDAPLDSRNKLERGSRPRERAWGWRAQGARLRNGQLSGDYAIAFRDRFFFSSFFRTGKGRCGSTPRKTKTGQWNKAVDRRRGNC